MSVSRIVQRAAAARAGVPRAAGLRAMAAAAPRWLSATARARQLAQTAEDDAGRVAVHERRTRISMADHFAAIRAAQEPVTIETADPLDTVQAIMDAWRSKPQPAALWAQLGRLAQDGSVGMLELPVFNALLEAFSAGEDVPEAVLAARAAEIPTVLGYMVEAGCELDSESYNHLIRFYGKMKNLEEVERYVLEAGGAGLTDEVAFATAEAYVACGRLDSARSVFEDFKASHPDIADLRPFYLVLIEGHAAADDIEGAVALFNAMQREQNYRHPARSAATNPLLDYYARHAERTKFFELFYALTPTYLVRPDQRAWRARMDVERASGHPGAAIRTFYRHIRNKTPVKRDALVAVIPAFIKTNQLSVLLRVMRGIEHWVPFRDGTWFAEMLVDLVPDPRELMKGISYVAKPGTKDLTIIRSIVIQPTVPIPHQDRGLFFSMYWNELLRRGEEAAVEPLFEEARKPAYAFLPSPPEKGRVASWPNTALRPLYDRLIAKHAALAAPGQKAEAPEGALFLADAAPGMETVAMLYHDMQRRRIAITQDTLRNVVLAYLNSGHGAEAFRLVDVAQTSGLRLTGPLLERIAEADGVLDNQRKVVRIILKDTLAAEAKAAEKAAAAAKKAEAKAETEVEVEEARVALFA
ncbi:hypothetical protein DFJ74DRAFT_703081 [Hyaloraphidium curvatum]|nr:hypothetical protein DFJ74DRAFT_703081 [Hyaloraphidium curvatum]